MAKLDSFTNHRIRKFILDFRARQANLPTLRDLEAAGFDRSVVDLATREEIIVSLYVTLTTGAVVKGFKTKTD